MPPTLPIPRTEILSILSALNILHDQISDLLVVPESEKQRPLPKEYPCFSSSDGSDTIRPRAKKHVRLYTEFSDSIEKNSAPELQPRVRARGGAGSPPFGVLDRKKAASDKWRRKRKDGKRREKGENQSEESEEKEEWEWDDEGGGNEIGPGTGDNGEGGAGGNGAAIRGGGGGGVVSMRAG